jgi:hypothetical protein
MVTTRKPSKKARKGSAATQGARVEKSRAAASERPLSAYRGILRGMPTEGHREKKDRL